MLNMTKHAQVSNGPQTEFSKLQIIKNIIVLSACSFMIFTGFEALSMLQSTLNHENGVGVICQALSYVFFCISALLLPKYIIKKFGCKITLVVSIFLIAPYISSNLYPHWSLMVPTSILSGSAAALCWSSLCQYLNEIAVVYASTDFISKNGKFVPNEMGTHYADPSSEGGNKQNAYTEVTRHCLTVSNYGSNLPPSDAISYSDGENFKLNGDSNVNTNTNDKNLFTEDPCVLNAHVSEKNDILLRKNIQSVTATFFGIHGMAFLSTHMSGNLMSYLVLKKDAAHPENILNSSCICGAHFCNEKSDCLVQNLQEPSQVSKKVLIGLCVGLILISILLLTVFLDSLYDQKEKVEFSFEYLLATCKHLKKKNQIFLMPITFYVGMIQGFYTGDFNMAFVGCAWGIFHVGLVSVSYGAICATSSFLSGFMVKYLGRVPTMVFAASLNLATLIVLIVWNPSAKNPVIFFLIAGLLGFSIGIFWSQLKAFYGFVFKNENEVAFAAYHFLQSLGTALSFAYSNYLCTYMKIYILMSVLILSIIGYICVEVLLKHKIKDVSK